MESKAKLMGHPIHPMLIVFPLGLFVTSVVFDIAYLLNGNEFFPRVSFYNISAGIIGGLLAAIFGFRDYLAIPSGTRAKTVGLWHGLGNVVVMLMFAISWFMRQDNLNYVPSTLAFLVSLLGIGLGTVTAWLGGELVDRLGVGVDTGANLNAPNSLSGQPASTREPAGMPASVPVTGGEKYQEKHIQKNFPVESDLDPKQSADRDRDDLTLD